MSRPISTGASTSTCRPIPRCRDKGGCFPHPPAAGMCPGKSPSPRCSHPKLALLEFKCAGMSWGARRGDCADTSPARGVLVPPSGALQTLWSWEGRIPAGIIPATPHPSMARPPHPAEPPCAALGVHGQGGVRCWRSPSRPSPAFPQPGWFHGAGRIPAGAQPKPTHSLQSDLRLGFTAPAVSGRRGSCPNPQLLPSPACVPPEPALGPRCQSSGGRTEGGAVLI